MLIIVTCTHCFSCTHPTHEYKNPIQAVSEEISNHITTVNWVFFVCLVVSQPISDSKATLIKMKIRRASVVTVTRSQPKLTPMGNTDWHVR